MSTIGHHLRLTSSVSRRCLQLAKNYLVVPDQLHRWCVVGLACVIALLIGCFITYAYVEKYYITTHFFYGRVRFSFIDGGYPELFGYALELAASILFFLFAFMHRKKQWYMWAAIMFVIFLDDSMKLHETIGHAFRDGFNLSPVVGDLIGFASTGFFCAVFWITGARMLTNEEEFSAYLVFTVYFVMLIFFGVGIDAVHGTLGKDMSQTLFTLLEDGGELLTTAIITLSVLGMWLRQKHAVTTPVISIDPALPKL